MPKGLLVEVSGAFPFAPSVAGCMVQVSLNEVSMSGLIEIVFNPDVDTKNIADVLQTLRLFFGGESFRSINFETGVLLVIQADQRGTSTMVSSDVGNLRDDGVLEFPYPVPPK